MQICPNCGEENPARFRLCGFCGTPLTPALPALEVRKTVTVVFSDLKGSTNLGEALDSESLREVMSRYFDEMRAILEHHGGTVEKYIGDAIMAVFGLPRVREDDALRAVRAAASMQQALAKLNDELERRWGVRLENRTGVNTGEVVAGDPTTGQRLVTGDTVNVAARLEQAAPALEILIGESTYRLARDAVEVEEIEPLELKGKAERVPAYRLLSVADELAGAVRDRVAPLVGRTAELDLLLDAFDRALADRRCQTLTLIGDAGVGKSRLAEEFLVRASGSALAFRGRCLPYGDGVTFWPVVEAVREAAGISDRDQTEVARRKLDDLVGPEHMDVADRVAAAVGLSAADFSVQELFWGIRQLITVLAENRPLVLAFEDLHWAEATFLDLVEHLTTTLEGPIVLLCDARPDLLEKRPTWPVQVRLEPLTEEESRGVIDNLLGQAGLDEQVRTRIVQSAQGNPLFVEQLLSMLIDEERVRLDDGGWHAVGELDELAIPPTIQALLAARIDALEREERAVIEPAAVIGFVFSEDAVRELAPDAIQDQVPDQLGMLTRKQLVLPAPHERTFADAYRFHHVLIRETTYEALLKRARATLHERFVRWADRVNGDRAREYEEILGYHLEQAHNYLADLGPLDDHGLALGADGARRLESAGRRARGRGDIPAAASLLQRASQLLPKLDPKRLALLPELGESLIDLGRFDEADAVLTEAISTGASVGDRRLETDARLRYLLLEAHTGGSDRWSDEAVPQIHDAIEVFTDLGDDGGLARAYRLLGYVHGTVGNYSEATHASDRALYHAREADDKKEERINATSYALSMCWGPTPVEAAIPRCEEILDHVTGNRLSRGWVLCLLAHLRAMQGEFDTARELYLNGRAAMEEIGQGWFVAWTSLCASRVEALTGDFAAAERLLRSGVDLLAEMDERYLRSTVSAHLARAVYVQGRMDEAADLASGAAELAGADDVETQALSQSVRAQVLANQGRYAEALALAQAVVDLVSPSDFIVMKIESLAGAGEAFAVCNDERAADVLAYALKLAALKGNVAGATQIQEALGRLQPEPAQAGRASSA